MLAFFDKNERKGGNLEQELPDGLSELLVEVNSPHIPFAYKTILFYLNPVQADTLNDMYSLGERTETIIQKFYQEKLREIFDYLTNDSSLSPEQKVSLFGKLPLILKRFVDILSAEEFSDIFTTIESLLRKGHITTIYDNRIPGEVGSYEIIKHGPTPSIVFKEFFGVLCNRIQGEATIESIRAAFEDIIKNNRSLKLTVPEAFYDAVGNPSFSKFTRWLRKKYDQFTFINGVVEKLREQFHGALTIETIKQLISVIDAYEGTAAEKGRISHFLNYLYELEYAMIGRDATVDGAEPITSLEWEFVLNIVKAVCSKEG